MNDRRLQSEPIRQLIARLNDTIKPVDDGKHSAPLAAHFKLGDIMLAAGQITRQQLDETLRRQPLTNMKFGELLVASGHSQQTQIEQGLRLQTILATVALGLAVALFPPGNAEAGGNRANFSATASVKSIARLAVLHQQPHIIITSENIAQGYLEVTAASRLEVKNTSRAGYMISFEVLNGPIRDVFIRGLGTELQLNSGSGWLLRPYSRTPELLELTYRFTLAADTKPGTYAWPLQIQAMAV